MILRYQWSYRAISPAIKCHGRDNWIRLLTTVLLCPRSTIRDEIADSPSDSDSPWYMVQMVDFWVKFLKIMTVFLSVQ